MRSSVGKWRAPAMGVCLLLLCLSATSFAAGERRGRCSDALHTARQKLKALFETGLDNERATVGYVGISQSMVERLRNNETILNSSLLMLDLTEEHPRGAEIIKKYPLESEGISFSRREMISAAAGGATLVSAFDQVVARARVLDPDLNPMAQVYLWRILQTLYWHLPLRALRAPTHTVTYDELFHAIGESDLSYAEPTIVDGSIPPALQALLNLGDNYEYLMIRQKMHTLLQSLGLPDNLTGEVPAQSRRRLEKLVAALPVKDVGYVVGVRSRALPSSISGIDICLSRLRLSDVTGIEPLSQPGFDFLSQL